MSDLIAALRAAAWSLLCLMCACSEDASAPKKPWHQPTDKLAKLITILRGQIVPPWKRIPEKRSRDPDTESRTFGASRLRK